MKGRKVERAYGGAIVEEGLIRGGPDYLVVRIEGTIHNNDEKQLITKRVKKVKEEKWRKSDIQRAAEQLGDGKG